MVSSGTVSCMTGPDLRAEPSAKCTESPFALGRRGMWCLVAKVESMKLQQAPESMIAVTRVFPPGSCKRSETARGEALLGRADVRAEEVVGHLRSLAGQVLT